MTTEETTTVGTVTPAELYNELLQEAPLFLLDVRNEEEFQRSKVEGRHAIPTLNIPYFDFIEDEDAMAARVPDEQLITVICAKEGSSQYVAELLAERGYRTRYVQGGFKAWANYYDVRDVFSAGWGRLVQVARPARGDVSFVLISNGEAVLIDPLRHIEHYTGLVAAAGARITAILDTHVHADHISGGPALAAASGAPYYVHPYDAIHPIDMLPATISYRPLLGGERINVGTVTITVHWYPGHTLGQLNYRADAPDGTSMLFTGDGIFLNSFGRPDLGGQAEAWTPLLYRSMTEVLPTMVDAATWILPSHFSSLGEATPAGLFTATYAEVERSNDALTPRTAEAFSAYVLSHLPVFPPEYVEIKRVNIGLVVPTEDEASELEIGKNICALSA